MSSYIEGRVSIEIDSQLEQVALLNACTEGLARQCELDEVVSYQLQTCIAEAVNNAIIHAYQGEAGHTIQLCWSQTATQITIDVLDRGITMPDPPDVTLPEPEAESGRGWFIITSWMDKVRYTKLENGQNSLQMVKYLSQPMDVAH